MCGGGVGEIGAHNLQTLSALCFEANVIVTM